LKKKWHTPFKNCNHHSQKKDKRTIIYKNGVWGCGLMGQGRAAAKIVQQKIDDAWNKLDY